LNDNKKKRSARQRLRHRRVLVSANFLSRLDKVSAGHGFTKEKGLAIDKTLQ
jgi:hypothetical protein